MNQLYFDIELIYKELSLNEKFDENTFAIKAFDQLNQFNPSYPISDKDIIDITLNLKTIPKQYYNEKAFGDFNITLFQGSNFSIQLYLMNNIDTEIHDHGFVGAYKLLKGSNIQNNFRFVEKEKLDNEVSIGNLEVIGKKKYQQNETSILQKGLIHQITRLTPDNITLMVMRNYISKNYVYTYPNLQITNNPPSTIFHRKLYALAYLYEKELPYKNELNQFLKGLKLQELITTFLRIQNYPFGKSFKIEFKEKIYKKFKEQKLNTYIDEHLKYLRKQKFLSQMK